MSAGHQYVAFIRAINVGGNNRVPMADLRAVFEAIGCTDVRTVLQSGNVAFRCAHSEAKLITASNAAFEDRFGFRGDVAIRTAAELVALTDRNPYLAAEPDGTKVHVGFANAAPTAAAVAALDPDHAVPDRFTVDGRDVFIWYPNGAGRSKLKLRLGVPITSRNWNTVVKMQAIFE
ncbi:MAG: hypothetical protein JWM12_895 [Ilumatobacteraceae bacterium]|nr:hypothetical protein [Ilumatobacteraceae bacterium]